MDDGIQGDSCSGNVVVAVLVFDVLLGHVYLIVLLARQPLVYL
jgi:hypothetical protein